jgi:hypothetical protein
MAILSQDARSGREAVWWGRSRRLNLLRDSRLSSWRRRRNQTRDLSLAVAQGHA